MLRIIDRYLLRELAQGFLAATVVLLLITVGGTVADLLATIARGRIPPDLLFSLVGLRTIDGLTVLLPLAIFLGVLLAFGRLYRDSEMAVFSASGLGLFGLMRPLLLLAIPAMILLGLLSMWIAPASVRLAQHLLDEASRSLIVAGLEPGRFVLLPGRDGVIFVGEMSSDGVQFKRMFVESERKDKDDNTTHIDILTADHGNLYHDADGVGRYLALKNGYRVEGRIGEDNFRLMQFQRNDLKLPDNETDENADGAKRMVPTWQLLSSDDPVQHAEFHWRLAAPISALVLTMLALPLARSSPRQPRYARLIIAILAWLVYASLMGLARSWISQGKLPNSVGFWWLYVGTIGVAALLIWRGMRLPRPRAARKVGA
ncbi:MAG: LPS export ABC transporter permease LptF [Dokdonella sp.]